MIEPGSQNEYEVMSPRERNLELKKLVQMFPQSEPYFSGIHGPGGLTEEIMALSEQDLIEWLRQGDKEFSERSERSVARRSSSELFEAISPRIETLIDLSPTTASFKKNVKSTLKYSFTRGIKKDSLTKDAYQSPFEEPVRILLDVDNQDSEGIFGNRAEFIETYFYSESYHTGEYINGLRSLKERLTDTAFTIAIKSFVIVGTVYQGHSIKDFRNMWRETNDQTKQELSQWRSEFNEVYGTPPNLLPKKMFFRQS